MNPAALNPTNLFLPRCQFRALIHPQRSLAAVLIPTHHFHLESTIVATMDQNLAKAVTDKKPVPEIDFTLHNMEDGSQVSTMERVVKGTR